MILHAGQQRDTDIKDRLLDSVWEARVGWFKRIALKHIHYHMQNRWLVQVQRMKQGTQSQFSETTQRDRRGREVGGAFRTGGHMYCCLVLKSCPTLCNPVDCSPSGSSVHEILQARTLEWVAISLSRTKVWKRKSLNRVWLFVTP